MKLVNNAKILFDVARWRMSWYFRNTDYSYRLKSNPKFMGPMDAIQSLVRDGDVVGFSGLGGNQHVTILYCALRDSFLNTGHPRDLTVVAIGGMGGRGRIPGTLEELGRPGLMKRFIGGHLETYRSFLKLADQGELDIQVLPQGVLALLIDAQARGASLPPMETGKGTFLDPSVGRGSRLLGGDGDQLVSLQDNLLQYQLPPIDVAIVNAPAADPQGNIYLKNAAIWAESKELVLAAGRSGGKVIVNIGLIVDEGYDDIFLTGDQADAVVYWPRTEQVAGIPHHRHYSLFTPQSSVPVEEASRMVRFVNTFVGITPRRGEADKVLARLAAQVFADQVAPDSLVNVGVGLPEEVCQVLLETGILDEITLFTESGVIGGVPAPGVFFGSAVCPKKLVSSAEIFKRVYKKLDVTLLGALQVDSEGNVNVSKRGDGARNYVGPGGFIDLTTAADLVLFVTSWKVGDQFKFVEKVDEITFPGQIALEKGKRVHYVTHVGAFELTPRGMTLRQVMPGIDIQKDILDACPMTIRLPEENDVPTVDRSVLTGEEFHLKLRPGNR